MFKAIIHMQRNHTISVFFKGLHSICYNISWLKKNLTEKEKEVVTFHFEINEAANNLFQLN